MTVSDGNTAPEWVPTGSVTVRVPGKVNLYLAVGDRRDDGYHELTTVFHAVSLFDEVTVCKVGPGSGVGHHPACGRGTAFPRTHPVWRR